jgi:hypothetical protein
MYLANTFERYQEIWRTAGFGAEARGEGSLTLLPAGTGNIAGNSYAPIPVDSFPLLESGEIIIVGLFRSCMQGVVGGQDFTV